MADVFQNPTKSLPKKPDGQTVRVSMEENEVAGRKSHLPAQNKSPDMGIKHVPSEG